MRVGSLFSGIGGPDDNDAQAGKLVSYALNAKKGNRDDGESETFVTHSLRSGRGGGRRDSGVAEPEIGVRRLTPTECERLQGFPDDWTQLGDTPDSRRYSALGDAVTVNVAEWIGGRLAA